MPDGTSYNAYLVKGSEATAIIDSSDPDTEDQLLDPLGEVDHVDYIDSQHAEQDHSGAIPVLMEKYPGAKLLCSKKAEDLVISLLNVPAERIQVVEDGETVSLGDKSMRFIYHR